ncbi:YjcZ family sporulation protein [Paenibacillus sp. An7]|nr:YjcZ family sporulation protein [Paenibacillus sp. An7]
MSEAYGYGFGGGYGGGWTSIGAILVLFILLVIISKTILY